jgi:hypothetical protein
MRDFSETFDDIMELEKNLIFLKGSADIKDKQMIDNQWWNVLGKSLDEAITEFFQETEFDFSDGEWEYDMVLRITPTYYHEGRISEPSYLEEEWSRFKFIQTFEQRDREVSLNKILDENLFSF